MSAADDIASVLGDELDGDEDDEQEGTEEGAGEGEDPDEPGDDEEPEPRYTIKVDGEEKEVPVSELVQGYQRTADYTRKTQALAAERRRLADEASEVNAERAQYQQALQVLERQILPQEPDWNRLRVENPIEFPEVWAQYQQRVQAVNAIRQEQEKVAQLSQLQSSEQLQRHVEQEKELLTSAIPSWLDGSVASKERTALLEFGKRVGYSDEELAQIYDHRAIVLLRNAWLYEQARTRGPKAQQKISQAKPAPPGAGRGTARIADNRRATDRLRKSGRVEDAAALMTKFF
ncbi:MAG: hypothetical protein ABFE08_08995 [Armatimonadia bacterium]